MATFSAAPNPQIGNPANLIEQLGAEVAAIYGDAEQQMIGRVSRYAARGIDTPASAAERARILRELRKQGEELAQNLADRRLAERIIAIAEADGRAAAAAALGMTARGKASGITTTSANAIAATAVDLHSSLDQMRNRITRWMPDAYRQVISLTAAGMLSGVETFQQSQRRAAERFLARGVTGFEDRAGKMWRIGTYAEMATRTTVNRAWQEANIAQAQTFGISLCTIVIGSAACSVCASHAGRIYSTDGRPAGVYSYPHLTEDRSVDVVIAGPLQIAIDNGWRHPNCRCTTVPYQPGGTMQPASVHSPKAEADRDRLRELERRVRDLKRREAAAFDDITKADMRRRIRGAQANIRAHVDETGIRRSSYREQLSFSDGGTPGPGRTPRAPMRALTP